MQVFSVSRICILMLLGLLAAGVCGFSSSAWAMDIQYAHPRVVEKTRFQEWMGNGERGSILKRGLRSFAYNGYKNLDDLITKEGLKKQLQSSMILLSSKGGMNATVNYTEELGDILHGKKPLTDISKTDMARILNENFEFGHAHVVGDEIHISSSRPWVTANIVIWSSVIGGVVGLGFLIRSLGKELKFDRKKAKCEATPGMVFTTRTPGVIVDTRDLDLWDCRPAEQTSQSQ